ncbi:DNA polymerase III subunit alpha [Candidatus Sumerlaeota bacterium]
MSEQLFGHLSVRADNLKISAIALTDLNVLSGAPDFYSSWPKTLNKMKPIIGLTACLQSPGMVNPCGPLGPIGVVLLAKNGTGYRNLVMISSTLGCKRTAATDGLACLTLEEFEPLVQDLIILLWTGNPAAFPSSNISEIADETLGRLVAIAGRDNVFLELADHRLKWEHERNREQLARASRHGLDVVATNETRCLNREDHELLDTFLCIGQGKRRSDEDRFRIESSEYYLKSPEEMHSLFRELPKALSNTLLIAEACDFDPRDDLPEFRCPRFSTPGKRPAVEFLRELAETGLLRRVADPTPEPYRRRLEYELEAIHRGGHDDYFLLVWDVVEFARRRGIGVGPGDGPGLASLAAYCLGITDVDPLTHGLVFERFIEPGHDAYQCFGIEVSAGRAREILAYLRQEYGEENCVSMSTHDRIRAAEIIGEVGHVLGLSTTKIQRILSLIPEGAEYAADLPVRCFDEDAQEEGVGLWLEYDADPDVRELIDLARQLEGLPCALLAHPGDVVVAEGPLGKHIPISRHPAGEGTICQYGPEILGEPGFLALFIRDLSAVTVVETVLQQIGKKDDDITYWRRISRSDPLTLDIFRRGLTASMGCLDYFNYGELREAVARIFRPESFSDLAAIFGLHNHDRSGDSMLRLLDGRKNPESVWSLHPVLSHILAETHGVALYQEQVDFIIHETSGFSLGESADLCRLLGEHPISRAEEEKPRFLAGCKERGIEEEIADEIWELLQRPARFAFSKASSVAGAERAFRTAYLKAHHPSETLRAFLHAAQGDPDAVDQLKWEAKELGVQLT